MMNRLLPLLFICLVRGQLEKTSLVDGGLSQESSLEESSVDETKLQEDGGPLYKFSDAYIDRINAEGGTWKAGRNFPSNLSADYLYNHLIADKKYFSQFEWPVPSQRQSFDPAQYNDTLPDSFDAREHWPKCSIIARVPDTGACAQPHVYSAVAAFSDRRCIKSDGTHNEPLSTEYLTGCCFMCRYDAKRSCYHGSVFRTWQFLHKRGTVSGGAYGETRGCQPSTIEPCSHYGSAPALPSCENKPLPQRKCHTRCTNDGYGRDFFKDKHRTTIPYWVKETEEAIKRELYTNGPTTATFVLYDDFYHYKSGVYSHSSEAQAESYLHSAKLIGWGTQQGTPYWLLINPWGSGWGDMGTFKIVRGKFECELEYLLAAGHPKY